jgi:hypothetical protein
MPGNALYPQIIDRIGRGGWAVKPVPGRELRAKMLKVLVAGRARQDVEHPHVAEFAVDGFELAVERTRQRRDVLRGVWKDGSGHDLILDSADQSNVDGR